MDARAALAGRLGKRRLRVAPDHERGFRFESVPKLALEMRKAGSDGARPFDRVVAGESFTRRQHIRASSAGACRGPRRSGLRSADRAAQDPAGAAIKGGGEPVVYEERCV